MMLQDLLREIPVREIHGGLTVDVRGITQDSRKVEKNFLFVAIPGHQKDGRQFIQDALKKGASAVILSGAVDPAWGVPQIVVDDPRRTLAQVASRFYDDPSLKMTVIGITGTNGKTTLTYLLESILREAGRRPAVLGTVNERFAGKTTPSENTTPESVDLQKFFSAVLRQGATDVVMEVSSHALAMGRVQGIHFDVGVFTNLSQDHLDFHKDLEDYFETKLRLFRLFLPRSQKKKKFAVLNMEDPRSLKILEGLEIGSIRTGFTEGLEVSCRSFTLSEAGIRASVRIGANTREIRSALIGKFNLENILEAIGAAHALEISPDAIVRGIQKLAFVPGRLERIVNQRGIHLFVDYAHTPDALGRVGESLKGLTRGRLITVFGCGGDRDPSKRSLMGAKAALFSDRVIVTSDNPRTEDPKKIMDDILKGLKAAAYPQGQVDRIPLREEALKRALEIAMPDDVVLVAGKGHEDYQIFGTKKIHFSDQECLRKILNETVH